MRTFMNRSKWIAMTSSATALAVLMGGCPIGDPDVDPGQSGGTGQTGGGQTGGTQTNAAPTVSGGADQTVDGGLVVTLSAAASDPEGGALTYEWTQIGGAAVALADADSADASFVAPFASETLRFRVRATDPQGASAEDMVDVMVKVEPMLFIANFGLGGGISSYKNPATVNGNIAPATNLAGAATQLLNPADIVIDSAGALLVANYAGNRITAYDDAPSTNGNIAPDRNVSGPATMLAGPASLAIDAAADLMFVANFAAVPDTITIFADASKAAMNGNAAPTRLFSNAAISNPSGINLDSDGSLYIANSGANNVLVYADAGNLNGNIAPTRIIASPAFVGATVFDVFVDHEDRLYVLSAGADHRVFMFDDASSLNGAVMPDLVLTVSGANSMRAIVVDKQGVGYITDTVLNAIYSFDDIATLNGTLPPDRTISGASTQLNQPIRLFLLER